MRSHNLLALLVACGGGSDKPNVTPDVQVPDAQVDAIAVDAADPATLVEVTAYTQRKGDGQRDPKAIAVFVDPAGNFVKHGQVDANGVASAYMPSGGTVIVVQGQSPPDNLFIRYVNISVIRDVMPGDRVIAGSRTRTRVEKSGIQTSMYASYTPIGSTGPALLMACGIDGGIGNPRGITFSASCATPSFDLLAIGDDSTSVRKFVWHEDIPYASNGTFTIPNTWQAMPTTTTTFLNVPPNLTRVFASTFAVVDDLPFEIDRKSVEQPAAGTSAVALLYAPITNAPLVVANTIQGVQTLERMKVVPAQPADVTIDWAALPVPRAVMVQASETGATWGVTGSGAPDARLVIWAAEWLDGNNVQRYVTVEIVEPVTSTNATTLPSLPAAYAGDDPTAAAQKTVRGAAVQHVDYDNIAGYGDAKAHGPEIAKIDFTMSATPHQAKVSFGATVGF